MTRHLPLSLDGLPKSLVDVAEALGVRVALELMRHFGGQEMRIPMKPRPDHPIMIALGPEDGAALCRFASDEYLYVPHGRVQDRRRSVSEMQDRGLSRREIARELDISQRHVRRLANQQPNTKQRDLFDED